MSSPGSRWSTRCGTAVSAGWYSRRRPRCNGEAANQPIEESDPTAPTNPYGVQACVRERRLVVLGRLRAAVDQAALLQRRRSDSAMPRAPRSETHLIPLVLQAALGRIPELTDL